MPKSLSTDSFPSLVATAGEQIFVRTEIMLKVKIFLILCCVYLKLSKLNLMETQRGQYSTIFQPATHLIPTNTSCVALKYSILLLAVRCLSVRNAK